MNTPPLIEKILTHRDDRNLSRMTGFSVKFFWTIKKQWKHPFFRMRKSTLDELYRYFKLKPDEFYYARIKKTENSSDFILWELFKLRRMSLGLSVEQVAESIRWTDREIKRIENGDVLPYETSWYTSKLIELYQFSQEDDDRIRWHIVLLREIRDLVKIEEKKALFTPSVQDDMER